MEIWRTKSMNKRLSVVLVTIWFLSCLPSSCLPSSCLPSSCLPSSCLPSRQPNSVPYSVCPVFDGESLFIKILVNQCPESEISFRTQRKGSVFTYDKEKDMCTVEPRYRDRIQMKNDSNGRIFEFRNVTKEDMDEIYVIYASNTPHQRFVITRSTESSTTAAAPQPSSTTPGPSVVHGHTGLLISRILVLCVVLVMVLVWLWVKNHKNSKTKHLDMEANQQNVENERRLHLYVPGRHLGLDVGPPPQQDGSALLPGEGSKTSIN
ncbi:uncharacterized protein LOC123489648 [Coregonus clupeaformis]|uniref:uncharacterized protein LOC123489648 n=1 Tax=Coregonus clupeaformis TaxID=59861 RepID=UPI001E1C4E82|nr:uncharacterized protein LOC123489648 [Coregonus clupeaformis]